MRRILDEMHSFIRRLWFSLPLAVTALLSYGTRITTASVSLDDLCRQRYLDTYYFAQNRFGGPLFFRLLAIPEMYPFAEKLLSVLLLCIAAVLFCVLFCRAAQNRLHPACYTAFACLFVSYPLIAELWNYSGTDSVIALSFCFCALALLCMEAWFAVRRTRSMICAAVLIFFSLSFFESLAAVFVCSVFAVMMLRYWFGDDADRRWKTVLTRGLACAAVLAVGVGVRMAVSLGIRAALGLTHFAGAANTVAYGQTGLSFFAQLLATIKDLVLKYFFAGFYYFPIGVFGAAIVLSIALCGILLFKKRRSVLLLIVAGLVGSCFVLGLLQGATTPYRAAQPVWLFCAFVFMLSLQMLLSQPHRYLRTAAIAAVCMLCLFQSMNLNQWFSLNHLRSEEDKRTVAEIATRLHAKYDLDKPVVFVGSREVSPHIYTRCCADGDRIGFRIYTALRALAGVAPLEPGFCYTQTCVSSYFTYAVYAAYDPTTELLRLFDHYGYSFVPGTEAQWLEAHTLALDAPYWPDKNAILETPDYLIVKLGPIEWDGWRENPA